MAAGMEEQNTLMLHKHRGTTHKCVSRYKCEGESKQSKPYLILKKISPRSPSPLSCRTRAHSDDDTELLVTSPNMEEYVREPW